MAESDKSRCIVSNCQKTRGVNLFQEFGNYSFRIISLREFMGIARD